MIPDVKQRAARALAEWIVEHADGNDLDAVKANLFAAGAKNIGVELTNLLVSSSWIGVTGAPTSDQGGRDLR